MVRRRARPVIAAMTAIVALAGAGAGCGTQAPCGLQLCDVRDPGCQRLIADGTACLRGVSPVAVPVTIVAREDYLRQQTETVLSPQDEELFRSRNAVLALWGLAPPDVSPSQSAGITAGWVGASYSPADKQITIVDDGVPLDSGSMVQLLAHEFTHAIQDATFDLRLWFEQHAPDRDRDNAMGALVEGEATHVGDLAAIGLFGDQTTEIPWPEVYRGWQERARRLARESSLPVALTPLHFQYPFGTKLVHDAIDAGGWAAADALVAAPPSGEREVLAGFGTAEPSGGPWAEDLVDSAVPVLPVRFSFRAADRMGAWVAGVFFERAGLSFARDAAEGLRGDALSVFRDEVTGGVVGFWRFRFSSVELATTVRAGANVWANAAAARQLDRDVILSIASDGRSLIELPDNPDFRAAPPTTAASPANGVGPAGELRCALPAPW